MISFLLLALFGLIPALASICVLLPNTTWSTRTKALISRGALKIPFGITIGFFGILLLELAKQNVFQAPLLFAIGAVLYLALLWLYLFLYNVILNKVLHQRVTWRTILRALAVEVGVSTALFVLAFGISIATNLPALLP